MRVFCLTVARCWHAFDPWLACGGSLFYSSWVDWRVTECVCGGSDEPPDGGLSHLDHRVHRWSTTTRLFQHRPAEKKSLPLLKPNINGLQGRCVLCWEIHSCLHWRRFLTDIMVAVCHCYEIVNIASVLAKFWWITPKECSRITCGPDGWVWKPLTLIWFWAIKSTSHDLIHEAVM